MHVFYFLGNTGWKEHKQHGEYKYVIMEDSHSSTILNILIICAIILKNMVKPRDTEHYIFWEFMCL